MQHNLWHLGIIRENGWRMGLTYPLKTSLVLLNKFEMSLSRNSCTFSAKIAWSKVLKLKAPKNSKINPNFNCICSNHQVMLQLPSFEHPYVLCTCFCLSKVFRTNLINSVPRFTNAQSFRPFHQRLQNYPSCYLITKNVLSPQESTKCNIKSLRHDSLFYCSFLNVKDVEIHVYYVKKKHGLSTYCNVFRKD
jgi:hypothetical protein